MKFAAVWAEIANQNLMMRFVIATLGLIVITLSVISTNLALKEPIIIERACQTMERLPASASQSAEEIKSFVNEVLVSRFNSGVASRMAWMAPDQARQRKTEQDELEKRRLSKATNGRELRSKAKSLRKKSCLSNSPHAKELLWSPKTRSLLQPTWQSCETYVQRLIKTEQSPQLMQALSMTARLF